MEADEAVAGLMAALLPGGSGFPAACETGMGAVLAARLRGADAEFPARVLRALTGRRAAPASAEEWRLAAARMEALEPALFAEFRKYCYLTYYEQPGVVAAIRALGLRYNDSPLPEGYPDEPFEAGRDGPRHGRGRWVRTDEVRRLG